MTQLKQSPFHKAEVAVQQKLGVAEHVAEMTQGFIREAMPQQHRTFFSELPFAILGLVDKQGFPWALPVFGQQGFIRSPDAYTLTFDAVPNLVQFLDLDFRVGQKVGMIGIQLETRRRNRMNGVLTELSNQGFSIKVDQSFGNCPQYIQTRDLQWRFDPESVPDFSEASIAEQLSPSIKRAIENADTFFIASRTQTFSADPRNGIDASHRGGKPCFVKVEGNRLLFPDYSGNRFFNTLGNIESDGRVGLCFPDFASGTAVFAVGRAKICWEHEAMGCLSGAERIVQIDVERSVSLESYLPLQGKLLETSPRLQDTTVWSRPKANVQGFAEFQLIDKVRESRDITSFYLAPQNNDGKVSTYTPGQFLPIKITTLDGEEHFRNYTLSTAPNGESYRLSIKREAEGIVSKFMHDHLHSGDVIHVGHPAGKFTLRKNNHSVVFLSGGVGITPMIAMLEGIIDEVNNGAKPRPVWFIHGTRNTDTLAFAGYLDEQQKQHSWLEVVVVYSRPSDNEGISNKDAAIQSQAERHVSIELLKRVLPFDHYDFYLCGGEAFMRTLYKGLVEIGVQKGNIFYEFFGAGSIEGQGIEVESIEEESSDERNIDEKSAEETDSRKTAQSQLPLAKQKTVKFSASDVEAMWTPEKGTLLELAEQQGLSPSFSCRLGQCGACLCNLKQGQVTYTETTEYQTKENEVLLCCARPAEGDVILEIEI